jgi:hypothetical protein
MRWLRDRLRGFWRKVRTVEPVRDDDQSGDGPVAPDVFRNLPPGGGGPGD